MKCLPGVLLPSFAACVLTAYLFPAGFPAATGDRVEARQTGRSVVGRDLAGPGLACGTLDPQLFTACLLLSLLGQMCR